MSDNGWIGVDLDGTLARYDGWKGPTHIGEPVPAMLARVKHWLAQGLEVRIFTARVTGIDWPGDRVTGEERKRATERYGEAQAAKAAIEAWCLQHLGKALTITNVKDYAMLTLYDDRAVQVEQNTGRIIGHDTRGLS